MSRKIRFRTEFVGRSVSAAYDDRVDQVTIPSREDYLHEAGSFSSHPSHAAARLRAISWAAIGTAVILCGLLGATWFLSIRASDAIAFILDFPAWEKRQAGKIAVVACIAAFALTVLLTASVQIRAALIREYAQRGSRSLKLEVASVALILALAAVLPYMAARSEVLWIRIVADVVALAPLPFLITFLEYAASAPADGSAPMPTGRLLTTGAVVGLIVAPFLLFQFAADWLNMDIAGRISGWIPSDTIASYFDGGKFGPSAPEWLRRIQAGEFGAEAKKYLDAALAAAASGADPVKQVLQGIQQAVAPWVASILRIVSLVLLLPAVAATAGLAVFYARAVTKAVEKGDKAEDPKATGDREAKSAKKSDVRKQGDSNSAGEAVAGGSKSPAADEEGEDAADAGSEPNGAKPGCVGRVIQLVNAPFRALFGAAEEEAEEEDSDKVGELVSALKAAADDGKLDGVVSLEQAGARGDKGEPLAPSFQQPVFDTMFEGNRPSVDQVLAIATFVNRYMDHIEEAEQVGFGGDCHTHPDFFVEAPTGGGATSALLAMAFYAVVVRGQKVLLLVGNGRRQKEAIARLRKMLSKVRMERLVTVGSFREDEVGDWSMNFPRLVKGEISANFEYKGIPEIIVSTIEEWERVSQSPAFDQELIRSVVLDAEVVLVDDFCRGSSSPHTSLHLPFMLDKHRLVLRSELRTMQLVVAAPPLDEGTRELLAARLFGGNLAPHVVRLRRARAVDAAVLEATTASAGSLHAIRVCAGHCLKAGFSVVVYKPNADVVQGEELAEQLKGEFGRPRVVGEIDDLPEDCRHALSAILYRQAAGEDPGFALAARIEGKGALIIRFREEGVSSLESVANPIPVLASARARAPFFAHLRSAVRFLRPMTPVHRNDWARFGLRERGGTSALQCSVGERFGRDASIPMFNIDPPEPAVLSDREVIRLDDAGIWPFVSMRPQSAQVPPRPVMFDRPIIDELRLHLAGSRRYFELGHSGRQPDRRRYARWLSRRDEELGESDLAYADRLLFKQGSQHLRPDRIESAGDSRESRHQVRGTAFHDDPLERVVPVIEISFEIEPHAAVEGPEQIAHPAVEWYSFEAARRPLVCRTSITKLADVSGNRAVLGKPVSFEMDCAISVLTIGMPMPERERAQRLLAMFAGVWTTAPMQGGIHAAKSMWPAMTACLQVAIRRLMPDFPGYARCIAFRPPRGGAGACIFFIEPAGTAGTAVETMRTVLDREELRTRFHDSLIEAIGILRKSAGKAITAPHYEGEVEPRDLDEVEALFAVLGKFEAAVAWKPGDELGLIRSSGPADDTPWCPPGYDSLLAGFPPLGAISKDGSADHHWSDHNPVPVVEWRGDSCTPLNGSKPVEYGVRLPSFTDESKRDLEAFGYSVAEFEAQAERGEDAARAYLQSVGFKFEGGAISADYEWMVERSLEAVKPLAESIVARARQAGATSDRACVAAIVTFVTSLRYEVPKELNDGRSRFEVRMPTDSLARRSGDCDSMSVLALALVRAAGLADGSIIVTHDHALLGLKLPVLPGDDWVDFPSGRYLLVECTEHTDGSRLGRVWREIVGVSVRRELGGRTLAFQTAAIRSPEG